MNTQVIILELQLVDLILCVRGQVYDYGYRAAIIKINNLLMKEFNKPKGIKYCGIQCAFIDTPLKEKIPLNAL